MMTRAQLQERIRRVLVKHGPHTMVELKARLELKAPVIRAAIAGMSDVVSEGNTKARVYRVEVSNG